jgi:AcrR family transcriptional regulator
MTTEAQRRSLILAAADRLLRHYGPQKTTVADVAREAGVGVGTVYLEFPSKDAIVEELSRSRHLSILAAMRAAASDAGRPFLERVPACLDARLEAFLAIVAEGAHACDLVHCISSGVKSAQVTYYAEEHALVAETLRQGARAAELFVEDADLAARTVLRAYVSFTPAWLRDKDPQEIRRAHQAMHQLVLYGLSQKPRPQPPPVPYPVPAAGGRKKRG